VELLFNYKPLESADLIIPTTRKLLPGISRELLSLGANEMLFCWRSMASWLVRPFLQGTHL